MNGLVSKEDVIRGFRDVDKGSELAAYERLLELLDSLPYYQDWKRRSYQMLSLAPGVTVLEVGCGLGDDARRMAELVSPGGKVTAIDASARMLEAAAARGTEHGVEFRQADMRRLPFADGSFMRSRTDRVLQHVERPHEAIAEMARVLEPGGCSPSTTTTGAPSL